MHSRAQNIDARIVRDIKFKRDACVGQGYRLVSLNSVYAAMPPWLGQYGPTPFQQPCREAQRV